MVERNLNSLKDGFYFGFAFGVVQMLVWYFFPVYWILPLFGLLVGYATNWLALKLIFQPIEPIHFMGKISRFIHKEKRSSR